MLFLPLQRLHELSAWKTGAFNIKIDLMLACGARAIWGWKWVSPAAQHQGLGAPCLQAGRGVTALQGTRAGAGLSKSLKNGAEWPQPAQSPFPSPPSRGGTPFGPYKERVLLSTTILPWQKDSSSYHLFMFLPAAPAPRNLWVVIRCSRISSLK